MPKPHYRAIWISDAHLCGRDCQVGCLHGFLRRVKCDYLYIVGDFFDFWQFRGRWRWPREQHSVLRRILKMAKKGTRIYYIPGNHDEVLRDYEGTSVGGVEIRNRTTHTTLTGQRLLVMHGDEFDTIVQCHRWLAVLGSVAYDHLIFLNRIVNFVRRLFKLPYYSLSGAIKRKVKRALLFARNFEEAAVHAARREGLDGIICGHIHQPALREINGVLYANCGDWVENCTAVAETLTGELVILNYTDLKERDRVEEVDEEAEITEPAEIPVLAVMRMDLLPKVAPALPVAAAP
jgi:UDP-2,3-diacylglucosamine pyrophosphatase LpxH